jgi:tetratricopeptide (TPR) repeat protein
VTSVRHAGNPSLREAEGYLDLLIPPTSQLRLPRELRIPLAQRALAALDNAFLLETWSAHALFLRGQALRIMERYSDAVEPLRQAAEIAPEDQHVRLALAWCYKRCQRLDLAIQSLEEALEFAPDSAILHYNLACYWSLARQVRRVASYLSRAFELDPDYRDSVASEPDFDPVRSHPHFQSLLSVIV